MIQLFLMYSDISILILRGVLGGLHIGESIPKLKSAGAFTEQMKQAGVKFPISTFLFLAGIELCGGICLLLGLFTQLMAVLLICGNIGMFFVSKRMGISQNKKILALSLASLALLATTGGGVWSVDDWFGILIY